jgi:ribosomal protein L7/L12
MTLLYIGLFFIFASCVLMVLAQLQVRKARQKGIYPKKGAANMEDVKRLLSSGYYIFALRAYREIHGVSLKEAKKQVDLLK